MNMRAYSTNSNPLAAFNIPGITDSGSSLSGIGYDPTSLTSIQNFGLPSFGSTSAPASNIWTDIFGKDGKMGYANTAMNLIGGGVGLYSGIKALGMAEDQFKFNKENILRDRAIKEGMLARTEALQDQNRAAARGYPSTNQSVPSIPNIPSIYEQMKKYGA